MGKFGSWIGACAGLLGWCAAGSAVEPTPGKPVAEFVLPDYQGVEHRLSEWGDRKCVVLIFLDVDCPVVKLYAPRLNELSREFGPRNVSFVGIVTSPRADRARIAGFRQEHGLSLPTLVDARGTLVGQIGAERTPEAILLDARRVIRYRGRIDDQYQPGLQRPRASRRDLAEAIEEVLADKPVSVPTTPAAGCPIESARTAAPVQLTYSRHVAWVLQRRCVSCHRVGQAAPFALTDYGAVSSRLRRIREAVEQGRMPPWHASPAHGTFANDARLTDQEKQILFDWIDGGAPEGDPRDLPAPAPFPEGWRIPEPNLVVSIPEPFHLPAQGIIQYQYFEVDPGFQEDKWIQAAEVRPSNRAVVHHGIVFLRPPGTDILAAQGDLKSVWLAAVGPGAPPLILPEGRAKRIPAGWRLVFQLHYVAVGSPQTDQTSIGLVFADPKTVRQEVATNMTANFDLRIPPQTADYRVEATSVFPEDMMLLSLNPHMHLRGKSFRYEAVYPDGGCEVLLDVPHFDFNWQNTYLLAEPKRLPAGTVLRCVAHFDNSKDNLANPDPAATVVWGEQIEDEMMIGYMDVVRADQDLTRLPGWGEKIVAVAGTITWPIYACLGVIAVNMLLLRLVRRNHGPK